jgi:hypothetical protein
VQYLDPDWVGLGRFTRELRALPPPARAARCHRNQPHRARGLCSGCYGRARGRGHLALGVAGLGVNPADLVILVPMLGRPHHVPPLLDSTGRTVPGARVLFVVSPHDTAVHQAVAAADGEMLTVPYKPRGDYARKINAGYRYTSQPLIFTGASDLRFHAGWFEAACAQLSRPGVGVVGTNDLGSPRVVQGQHSTHSLVTRAYADKYGTIDCPGAILCEQYIHEFVDDELVGTAKHRGAFAFAADSHVEHLHPNWRPDIPMDRLYAQQSRRMAASRQLYARRRRLWM